MIGKEIRRIFAKHLVSRQNLLHFVRGGLIHDRRLKNSNENCYSHSHSARIGNDRFLHLGAPESEGKHR